MSKYSPIGPHGHVDIYAASQWAQHKASKQPNSVLASKRASSGEVVPKGRSGHILARLAYRLRDRKKADAQSGQCALGAIQAAIERDRLALGNKAADKGRQALDQLAIAFADKDVPLASLARALHDMVDGSLAERYQAVAQARVIEDRAGELANRRGNFDGPDTISSLPDLSAGLLSLAGDYRQSLDACARYTAVDEIPGAIPIPTTATPSAATLVKTQNALRQLAYMTTSMGAALKKPQEGTRPLRFQLLDEELDRLLKPIQPGLKGEQLGELVHQHLDKCQRYWLAAMDAIQTNRPMSARNAMEQFQMEVENTIAQLSRIGGALAGSATRDPLQDGLRRSDRAALFDLGQLFLQVAYLLADETGALVQAHGAACSMGKLDDRRLRQVAQQRPVEEVIPPIVPPAVLDHSPSDVQVRKGGRRLPRRYALSTTENRRTATGAYTTVKNQLTQQQQTPGQSAPVPFQPLVKRPPAERQNRQSAPPGLTVQQLLQREQMVLLQPELSKMEETVFASPRREQQTNEADAELEKFLSELRPLSGPDSPRAMPSNLPTETNQFQPPKAAWPGSTRSSAEEARGQRTTEGEAEDFLNRLENDPGSIAPIDLAAGGHNIRKLSHLPVESTAPDPKNRRTSRSGLQRMTSTVSAQLGKVKKTITS